MFLEPSALLNLLDNVNMHLLPRFQYHVRALARKCADKHTAVIYIRVIYKQNRLLYSTGIKCTATDFNPKTQSIKNPEMNRALSGHLAQIINYLYINVGINKEVTLNDLKTIINPKIYKIKFSDLVDKICSLIEKPQTKYQFKHSLTSFLTKANIINEDINSIAFARYEKGIIAVKQLLAPSTYAALLSRIHNYLIKLSNQGVLTNKQLLQIDYNQLIAHKKQPRQIDNPAIIRDRVVVLPNSVFGLMAKLQYYAGVGFSDIQTLMNTDTENGNMLSIHRKKTDVNAVIPVDENTIAFINLLRLCELPNYQRYRLWVKATLNIRTHDLRHARARLLLDKGLSHSAISKFLGHASTKMTENYAPTSGRNLSAGEMRVIIEG